MSKIIDKRIANIQLQKSGTGSVNARINLPITWVRDKMGIDKNNREVEISINDKNEIIIKKGE